MRLFHGTSGKAVSKILEQGIQPRRRTKKTNWDNAPSHPNAIYLTTCYAGYFAHCAVKRSTLLGMVEIDTDKLYEAFLRPDEDFLEQAFREGGNRINKPLRDTLKGKDMLECTAWFREHLDEFSHVWRASVDNIGNCCYMGRIAPEAITRAVTFDYKLNSEIGLEFLNPTITLANYKFCSQRYKALTAWLFGDPVQVEDFLAPMPALESLDGEMKVMYEQRIAHWKELITNRSGITVLK